MDIEILKKQVIDIKKNRELLDNNYQAIVDFFMTPCSDAKNIDTPAIGYWAVEQLAAYLYTSLTNPSMRWLSLKSVKKNVSISEKQWIQNVEETIYSAFISPETFFNNQIHEFYLELVGFGTAVLLLQEEPESPYGLHFINIPIKTCYIKENYKGEVDALLREFTLTQSELIRKFDNAKNIKEQDGNKEFVISHFIYPKDNKYISIYFLENEDVILQEEEFSYFPFLISRWSKKGKSPYGLPPTLMAMSELKKIKQFEKIIIKQAHYAIEPAWFLPSIDVQFPIDRKPGGINFYKPGADRGYTMPSASNINIGEWILNKKEQSIIKCFYLDHISIQQSKVMTATEIRQRVASSARILSPITSRIESELLRPLIIKVFGILQKVGKLDIAGGQNLKELRFEYITALSKGQKYEELDSIANVVESVGIISQVQPDIVDNINWDKYLQKIMELYNTPLEILNSSNQIEEIRNSKAQALQKQNVTGEIK